MRISRCREIRSYVETLINTPEWSVNYSSNHHKLVHVPSGRKMPIPGSPSDGRAFRNFQSQVRRLSLGLAT